MKATPHADLLQAAWHLQPEKIAELESKLASIRQLKSDVFSIGAPEEDTKRNSSLQHADVIERPKAKLPARGLLRAPKPGSLRHSVHEALRAAAGPVRRAEIISCIARERDLPVDATLKVKVGDILTSGHDPYIFRIAHGIYRYKAQQ